MLAKIWKKLLLAICIIACIYNVMNKLVSRTSLEKQLKSIEVTSTINNEENKKTNNSSKVNKTEKNSNYNEKNKEDDNEEEENDDESEFVVVFDE